MRIREQSTSAATVEVRLLDVRVLLYPIGVPCTVQVHSVATKKREHKNIGRQRYTSLGVKDVRMQLLSLPFQVVVQHGRDYRHAVRATAGPHSAQW